MITYTPIKNKPKVLFEQLKIHQAFKTESNAPYVYLKIPETAVPVSNAIMFTPGGAVQCFFKGNEPVIQVSLKLVEDES